MSYEDIRVDYDTAVGYMTQQRRTKKAEYVWYNGIRWGKKQLADYLRGGKPQEVGDSEEEQQEPMAVTPVGHMVCVGRSIDVGAKTMRRVKVWVTTGQDGAEVEHENVQAAAMHVGVCVATAYEVARRQVPTNNGYRITTRVSMAHMARRARAQNIYTVTCAVCGAVKEFQNIRDVCSAICVSTATVINQGKSVINGHYVTRRSADGRGAGN
jgi:hypothetical protein